jgi:hypothetical protein
MFKAAASRPPTHHMDVNGISSSLLQQIGNTSTQSGDAVTVSVLRKAMDIQATQAQQLVEMVQQSVPNPGARIGSNIDIKV